MRDLRRHYGREYRILQSTDGPSALEALDELKVRGEHVALVLSDQRMPGMDGTRVLHETVSRYPNAKRALLTAYSDIAAAIAAINESHIDYYLLKPWDPPEEKLYPVLTDLLEDWQANFRPGFEGIKIIGDRWSALGHQLRDFLARSHIPYTFLDVETSDEAGELLRSGDGAVDLPLVILPGGERMFKPTLAEVAEKMGLQTKADLPFYDLAIVGAGPAGLATAVYGGSEGLATILIEKDAPGGQAGTSSRIENYLGFPAGLSGADLARRAVTQARKFEVEILSPQEVNALRVEGPYRHLDMADGSVITCHSLMLSMGVEWRKLPADGAENLQDQGIYYGAALTEAQRCVGDVVYTVGAGNSAGQAAIYFAQYATSVVMLVRGSSLEAKMSQYLVDRIFATDNIEVKLHSEISACHGEDHLEEIEIRNVVDQSVERTEAGRVFIFIGAAPHTGWLDGQIACDDHGFILTGTDLKTEHLKGWPLERDAYLLETNVPGIFASGDVRHESIKRVASAVGEGSVSVHFVHKHLATL